MKLPVATKPVPWMTHIAPMMRRATEMVLGNIYEP